MRFSHRYFVTLAIMTFFITFAAPADGVEDISFQFIPGIELPLGSKSILSSDDALYTLGGSATLKGQYIFSKLPLLFFDGNVSYNFQPTQADPLSLLSAGIGTGINLRIGNIMSFQAGAEAGWYLGIYGEVEPAGNPYFGGSAQIAWDFSPSFTLAAGAGYHYYLGYDEATESFTDLYQGLSVTLGTVFRLVSGDDRSKLKVEDIEFDPVFPVFYGYYDENAVGKVVIRNEENSPITDVNVYFNVNQYMDQPKLSATIPILRRGEEVEAQLNALFSNSVLQLTEATKVSAEILTEYTYLGRRFTKKVPLTLRILDRNSMTWDDDRKAACFITPKDPTVLLFSKNTAGLVRERDNSPIDLKLRIAIGIFEALRLYGMNYVIDPQSSYIEASSDAQVLDYLQFPSQSLTFRAGDCDDLSILYSALLESVGIETAFITIPGHIYMAFSLDMSERDAKKEFTHTEDLLFIDDTAWVPVEITLVTDGFMKAWRTGARQWREAKKNDKARFYKIHSAWETFEPVAMPGNALSLIFPSTDAIMASYRTNLDEFVDREVEEKADHYFGLIRSKGDTANLRNRLGILYARYGKYPEAEKQFLLSADRDRTYVAPLVNLGNLYFLKEEMQEALGWYEKAEQKSPENEKVLAGLARARYELEQFDKAEASYNRLAEIDPDLAAKYSYIGNQSDSFARASAAQERGKTYWEDEEDDE